MLTVKDQIAIDIWTSVGGFDFETESTNSLFDVLSWWHRSLSEVKLHSCKQAVEPLTNTWCTCTLHSPGVYVYGMLLHLPTSPTYLPTYIPVSCMSTLSADKWSFLIEICFIMFATVFGESTITTAHAVSLLGSLSIRIRWIDIDFSDWAVGSKLFTKLFTSSSIHEVGKPLILTAGSVNSLQNTMINDEINKKNTSKYCNINAITLSASLSTINPLPVSGANLVITFLDFFLCK